MARANPRFDALNVYYKEHFCWERDLYITDTFTDKSFYIFMCRHYLNDPTPFLFFTVQVIFLKRFDYHCMKEVLNLLQAEKGHEALMYQYMWMSYQRRMKKSEALFCDSSTFKRTCDKACKYILEHLFGLEKYE